MANYEEILLRDAENNEEFNLRLSPKSAFKARTDLSFVTTLLNAVRQGRIGHYPTLHQDYDQNNACLDDIDMSISEQKETEEQMGELIENKENFRWSHEAIMLLLEEYRQQESSMTSGKKSHKKAWDEIATTMHTKGYNVSGRQCMTRINTMKRTYKTIKDHNSKSGNNARTWKYYEAMESLLSHKPYITPLTTVSSTGRMTSRERSASPSASSLSSNSICDSLCLSNKEVSRKRKATDVTETKVQKQLAEERKEKRHKEKIEMGTKLLEKLDKLIEKI